MAANLDIRISASDHASAVFGKVGQSASGLGNSLSGFGSAVAGIGMGAGLKAFELIGSAFGAAKSSIIDLNASLEQSKIAFTTMLGSGEAATAFLGDLQKFAANTPFEFPELVGASKKMLAFGFDSQQVVPMLTAVGDAVAAVGGGADVIDGVTMALGQMKAKGKVSAEEMGQLAERGIPAWDMLAKKLGVDVPKAMDLVSSGSVKADTFLQAFQEGAAERFGGMMAKQSQTFSGAMSTITDTLSMATATAFKPFFDMLAQGVVALAGFLQSDTFTGWAESITGAINAAMPTIQGFATIIMDAFRTIGQVFGEGWNPDESINPFVNAVGKIATVFRDEIMPAIGTAASFIMEQLGVIVDWVTANWPLIEATVLTIWSAISSVTQAVWPAIRAIISNVVLSILDGLKILMQLITGDFSGAWETTQTLLDRVTTFWGNAVSLAWEAISKATSSATDAILTAIGTWISDTTTKITTGAADWLKGVGDKLAEMVTAAKTFATDFLSPITGLIASVTTDAGKIGSELLSQISTKIGEAVEKAKTFATDFLSPITGLVGTVQTEAGKIGSAISGLWESVRGFWDWLTSHTFRFNIELPKLPDWAIPGSPTPLEIGFRGIADSMREVGSTAAPTLSGLTQPPLRPALVGAGGGFRGGTQIVVQFHGPVYGFHNFEDEVVRAMGTALRRGRQVG